MAGSLTDAMGKLKNTIETINNKIVEGKGKVQEYKTQLIVRLQALNAQIKSLNFEGILSIVPKLKKELEESKYNLKVQSEQLVDATTELSQQKAKLEEQNKQIESLTREIDNLTQEIEAKKQEVDNDLALGYSENTHNVFPVLKNPLISKDILSNYIQQKYSNLEFWKNSSLLSLR